MRIKNEKEKKPLYIALETQTYNEVVSWCKQYVNEQAKAKAKIVQDKLLDFFAKVKKPTTIQLCSVINALQTKYLKSYPISIISHTVNTIDDGKSFFFNVYLVMNGYYRRQLIQENCHPNIDGKKINICSALDWLLE